MATVVGLESRWPVNAALVVSLQLDGIVNEIIGGMTVSICLGLVGWVWRRKRRVAEAQRSIPSGDGLIGHNFGDQDLRRVSLVGRKLPFSIFEGGNMHRVRAFHADLTDADLGNSSWVKASFNSATLRGTNMASARLGSANLEESLCEAADLQGQNLKTVKIDGARFGGANLSKVTLTTLGRMASWPPGLLPAVPKRGVRRRVRDCDFRGANLKSGFFHRVAFINTDFSGCDLSSADLRWSRFVGAQMKGAVLIGAKLEGAVMDYAVLCGARLQNANLTFASLHGVDLRGADLFGAVLTGADLRDAKLCGADFRYIDYDPNDPPLMPEWFGDLPALDRGITVNVWKHEVFEFKPRARPRVGIAGPRTTALCNVCEGSDAFNRWKAACGPGDHEVKLSGSDLSGQDLRSFDLSYAALSGSDLGHSRLYRANLTRSHLNGAVLVSVDAEERWKMAGVGQRVDPGFQSWVSSFDSTNLRGACLRGAKLGKMILANADFCGAEISGVDFRKCDFGSESEQVIGGVVPSSFPDMSGVWWKEDDPPRWPREALEGFRFPTNGACHEARSRQCMSCIDTGVDRPAAGTTTSQVLSSIPPEDRP
jgi:uncharacterized protein YjbI with pentapeptide repeats